MARISVLSDIKEITLICLFNTPYRLLTIRIPSNTKCYFYTHPFITAFLRGYDYIEVVFQQSMKENMSLNVIEEMR